MKVSKVKTAIKVANILPRNDIYDIVGNCFNKSIEECWEKYWKSKKIHYRNKIWMSEIKK